ncbi:zf-HC2 domain-containing protein [Geomicrobium sp. JCM 19039]|uniref:zf-HC2 domain-containing protein n=1 Tax=Geomicrobium sp. JCM 19039 TaxID=1460636 RepID=UPI00045F36B6|nr:zf-HC2 domain-containing protein [Geomicrobium sp. JCM 19039]GAK10411.1 hypothetical protein JCM19039_19 [Geomicrobium sp. JCM 19039]
MSCSSERIQRYFDGDLTRDERMQLYEHLRECGDCKSHYDEVKKSIALVQSASHITAPSKFTESVMDALPKRKRRSVAWKRWSRNHPMLVAASVFLVLMSSMVWVNWSGMSGDDVMVRGATGDVHVNYETNTVIIPEGETVAGDLTVRNGNVDVQGEVEGDLTVINGEQYMASAGNVAGNVEEINEILSWIWYETKSLFSGLTTGDDS